MALSPVPNSSHDICRNYSGSFLTVMSSQVANGVFSHLVAWEGLYMSTLPSVNIELALRRHQLATLSFYSY